MMLLRFGSTLHQGAGENLGSRDERAADTERCTREFLRRNAAGHVLALTALAESTELRRNGKSERADVCKATDDLFGNVGILTMDVFGVSANHLFAETAEGVLHHLVIVVEVAWAGAGSKRGEQLRIAIGGNERLVRGELGEMHRPELLATNQSAGQVVHHVGDECARDGCLEVTLGAVVDERASRFERCARMGQVVGERLLTLRSARFGETLNRTSQKCGHAFDDGCGRGEVFDGVVHESQR